MNKSHINLIKNRTSCRDYLNKNIERDKIEILKEVVNSSPTSQNSHSFSCVFITDENIKNEFISHSQYQDHIKTAPLLVVFIADLNRIKRSIEINNLDFPTNLGYELYTSCVVDAAIASGLLQSALLELGLDSCYLGVIRNYPKHVIEKLNISSCATPIFGMTIGYRNEKNEIKPKLNKVYEQKYNINQLNKELDEYSQNMKEYYETRTSNKKSLSWYDTCIFCYKKLDDMSNEYTLIIKNLFNLI